MGQHADDIIDRMLMDYLCRPPQRATFQSGAGDFCWREASGRVVSMWEMDVSHIQAAIAVCEERNNTGKAQQLETVLAAKAADGFPHLTS